MMGNSVNFLLPAVWLVCVIFCAAGRSAAEVEDDRPAGPMIGRLTPYSAVIWARLPSGGTESNCRLLVEDKKDRTLSRWNTVSLAERDWCVTWEVRGLRPGTEYAYRIRQGGDLVYGGEALRFKTPVADGVDTVVKIGFGSCSEMDAGSSAVFDQVLKSECDAMVLLGDTPYIDSTELAVQRRKHREFLRMRGLRELARCHPVYATWDDHDYGSSNADGRLHGKESSRKAFTEYRAHPPYGDNVSGVYSSFRHGPVEVFLLDTRYFANFEADPQHSLLGTAQWRWLTQSLLASTASVKVLASGTVWHDVPEEKPDCWARHGSERDALFRFIGENSIAGVVLVSGDLHQSRVVEHQTIPAVGYSIVEFVSSPIHTHTEQKANTPHPGLRKHLNVGNVYLQLEIDTQTDSGTVVGRFIDNIGKILHEETVPIPLLQRGD
ncbi:MAG: alkaline phosphatase D family protein [Verrucomicrobiae bacterium]|nr:alkaline phosphatase D family protein [Verrucomicrobiae bacterium]